jgi:4'-phosphopantetheinyl transferase
MRIVPRPTVTTRNLHSQTKPLCDAHGMTMYREVSTWFFPLPSRPAPEGLAQTILSPDEVRRADGYCFEDLRTRWIWSRLCLRELLALYTGIPAKLVEIAIAVNGKPRVVGHDLEFSVSHCKHFVAFAFAYRSLLGIDIECIDRFISPDMTRLALTQSEMDEHPERISEPSYVALSWTRKEAVLKAAGDGLSRPPNTFAIGDYQFRIGSELSARSVELSAPAGHQACLAMIGALPDVYMMHGRILGIRSAPTGAQRQLTPAS